MGGLFGLYAFLYGVPTGWYAIEYVILFGLIALFFFDFQYQVLPDVILAPLFVVAIARLGYYRPDVLVSSLAMGVLLAASLGLLYIISRGRWLGLGDVKLAAVIGMLFGFPVAIGITLIAIWSGALVGLVMIARRQATMKTALPFGSFWTAAAILALMIPEPVAFLSGLFIPVVQ
jgi:prepilin signal peptidase PulO-like enzyme (type II secretory pathway)